MEGKSSKASSQSMRRCASWLATQSVKYQSICAMPPEVDAIVEPAGIAKSAPAAVDEHEIKPVKVPIRKLRTDGLRMECEWLGCLYVTADYDAYQKHVRMHIPHLQVVTGPNPKYNCLWDLCQHQSSDGNEMIRHINYHSYHSKLMAVGASAQYNLKMKPCQKESMKRNKIPIQAADYRCRWVDCTLIFTAIQDLFTHAQFHIQYSEGRCGWGGCGLTPDSIKKHVCSHTGEKLIACPHCGVHTVNNVKLRDHLERQNVPREGGAECSVCGRVLATARLLRMHERQHVCVYACTYCDMTAPSPSALSLHVRYRHISRLEGNRPFKCDNCSWTSVTKLDLLRHMQMHRRNKKLSVKEASDAENVLEQNTEKVAKRYICHMCPDGKNKIYQRGTRLTTHLVTEHGAQWPDGHCRFRYQKSKDGYYRLTTTRYESLEVSRQIMGGSCDPKGPITEDLKVRLKKKSSATNHRPTLFEVNINSGSDSEEETNDEVYKDSEVETNDEVYKDSKIETNNEVYKNELNEELILPNDRILLKSEPKFEITVCDVDEKGNILRTEVIDSEEIIIGM